MGVLGAPVLPPVVGLRLRLLQKLSFIFPCLLCCVPKPFLLEAELIRIILGVSVHGGELLSAAHGRYARWLKFRFKRCPVEFCPFPTSSPASKHHSCTKR